MQTLSIESPHKLWRGYISGVSPERSTRIDCRPMLPMLPPDSSTAKRLGIVCPAYAHYVDHKACVPTGREDVMAVVSIHVKNTIFLGCYGQFAA